jgi:hypothetical protein
MEAEKGRRVASWKLAMAKSQHHTFFMLPAEQLAPEQIKIYRKMTPEQRLKVAEQLYWSARNWKAAGVRMLHPDWSKEQVEREVTRIFLNTQS